MGIRYAADNRDELRLVVTTAAEEPLLLAVTVADETLEAALLELPRRQRALRRPAPYGLLVSARRIVILGAGEPLELPAREIFRPYLAGEPAAELTPTLRMTLLEAWLSDLAVGWRGPEPPGGEALDDLGLRAALRAGGWHVVPDEDGSLRP